MSASGENRLTDRAATALTLVIAGVLTFLITRGLAPSSDGKVPVDPVPLPVAQYRWVRDVRTPGRIALVRVEPAPAVQVGEWRVLTRTYHQLLPGGTFGPASPCPVAPPEILPVKENEKGES